MSSVDESMFKAIKRIKSIQRLKTFNKTYMHINVIYKHKHNFAKSKITSPSSLGLYELLQVWKFSLAKFSANHHTWDQMRLKNIQGIHINAESIICPVLSMLNNHWRVWK